MTFKYVIELRIYGLLIYAYYLHDINRKNKTIYNNPLAYFCKKTSAR